MNFARREVYFILQDRVPGCTEKNLKLSEETLLKLVMDDKLTRSCLHKLAVASVYASLPL